MAQQVTGKGDVKTCLSGETMAAGAVVTFMTLGSTGIFVRPWITDTSVIFGVTLSGASATGEVIDVILGSPTVKCLANASISAGAIVGPATDAAGRIMERANPGTVTTFMVPTIGIALQTAGVTGTAVEVLLQPLSQRPSDG